MLKFSVYYKRLKKKEKGVTMSVCRFSTEYVEQDFIKLDHYFIKEFVPNAPDQLLKVYLYGLYACQKDISLETMSQELNLSADDIESAFLYWQEMGLVTILSSDPLDVRYLPSKYGSAQLKKYNKDKYQNFTIKAQEILSGRMITPTEYNEYYYLIESLHFEEDALLLLMQYCVQLKNNKVGYKYITTVARDFASDGITTLEKMQEKLDTLKNSTEDVKLILNALKLKRTPTMEEYQLYQDWIEHQGMELNVLLYLAKQVKSGGMTKLNQLVTKCIENKLYSIKEIEDYQQQLDMLYTTARKVVKNLGLRYENVDPIVENYILPWTSYGFDEETLGMLANQCFKQNIRTLSGLNDTITKLYQLGIITKDDLMQYFAKQEKEDQKIKTVLEKLGLSRSVNSMDRHFYRTWTIDWSMSEDLILYASTISQEKSLPLQYLNKLLSAYHTKKITTVEQAEKDHIIMPDNTTKVKKKEPSIKQRSYTKQEMSNLIQNIKEIDL